ncbi:MAG: isopentenyl phosphate kinase [Candidatus Micrarchaeia archaeon]
MNYQNGLIVLKVGGSAIADKNTGKSYLDVVAANVASDIPKNARMVIVCGASYVGHSLAIKYRLSKLESNQHEWALLRYEVGSITNRIIEKMIDAGHAPIELSVPTLFNTKKQQIIRFNFEYVSGYLNNGFIPVMHSDAPLDEENGISILSGDAIATEIAKTFGAALLIYGTDVDGILDKERKPIPKIDKKHLENIEFWKVKNDVSGGIRNKIEEAKKLEGTKVRIINLRKTGMLRAAIENKDVGTLIE